MFKSCLYCRHRKKKCVWEPSDLHGRCVACQHLDVRCEVEARQPSLKRQRTSQHIASSLRASSLTTTLPQRPDTDQNDETTKPQDGDCQIQRADRRPASKELLFQNRHNKLAHLSTTQKYNQALRQELPFVPDECLHGDVSPLFQHCVELAGRLSIYHGDGNCSTQDFERLADLVHENSLTIQEVAGLLLLLPRICPNSHMVEMVGIRSRSVLEY